MGAYTRYNWTNEELAAEAAKFDTRAAFKRGSKRACQTAQKRGLMDSICSHMQYLRTDYSAADIAAAAKICSTRIEFKKKFPSQYAAALNRGVVDEVCAHMSALRRTWTREQLIAEGLKYITRKDFSEQSNSAYNAARRAGCLEMVCNHMLGTDRTTRGDAIYLVYEGDPIEPDLFLVKVGISSVDNLEARIKGHRANFRRMQVAVSVETASARKLERQVLRTLKTRATNVHRNGRTEFRLVSVDEFDAVVRILKSQVAVQHSVD